MALRRAREAVAVPTRAPDRWKRPDEPAPAPNGHGESIGRVQLTRQNGHAPPLTGHNGALPAPAEPAPAEPDATPIAGFALGDWRLDLPDPMATEGVRVTPDGEPYLAALGPPTRPTPWRCPECPASIRKVLPDGSSRCPKGHVSREAS